MGAARVMNDTGDARLQDRNELSRIEHQHQAAGRVARAASHHADELRASAARITAASTPLTGILDAVRALHTPSTWEGRSATRSRVRLDTHEQRCAHALVTLNGILTDLDAQARVQSTIASEARAEQRRLSPRMYELQNGLGPI